MFFIEVHRPWKLFFDGVARQGKTGASIILITLEEEEVLPYAFTQIENCSNNVAEYRALIMGLAIAIKLKINQLKVFVH